MNKFLQKYVELTLNAKPSRGWKLLRVGLHWISLPIKLLVIGGLGGYQLVRQKFTIKSRQIGAGAVDKKTAFQAVLNKLPIYRKDGMELYVNRVPYWDGVNGWNHNTDHQASRHGTYTFLMGQLDKRTPEMDTALLRHIQNGQLARGFKLNPYEGQYVHNFATVSGDMLLGVSLAMVNLRKDDFTKNPFGDRVTGALKERFDELLNSIVENDYALLEGQRPEDGDINQAMWDRIQEENIKLMPSQQKKMKSLRANWQPGLETVGAQALTILAALRIGDKKLGAGYAKKEYRRLLFRYGYGLLSLIPTAFTQKRRGYFNDHNCMVALYILSKLADNKWGRRFWKIPMLYVWSLSKHYKNGYFTGLLEDAHPGTVNPDYISECNALMFEEMPLAHSFAGSAEITPTEYPVKFNEMSQDEFYPDMPQTLLLPPNLNDTTKYEVLSTVERYRSGLGWLACVVMTEKNVKELL